MNQNLNFYPILDKDELESLKITSDFMFYYINKDLEEVVIDSDINMNKYISLSNKTNWHSDEDDLELRIKFSLSNANILYGPAGIAPHSSQIGIALENYSQKSKTREVIISKKSIENIVDEQEFIFDCVFPRETYDGKIDLSIIIYLKEPGSYITENENFLNNETGVILGELDHKELYMSGFGSIFPIYIKDSNDKKLWNLEISYEDPAEDLLVNCVKLNFNSAHKDFDLININSPKYSEQLVNEIVSNAVTILIGSLKEDKVLDNLNDEYVDGSILGAIKYFKDVLGLDLSNIINTSSSLREYLNQGD